ncbi:hypothetical protein TIFTF001_008573 [Ficus carica]|uniref:Uncharacterized protein n=1 Tax=Ficus carica TaxID=3494 RepID=A0AA88CY33_FICCA|nr:hypothetical protein TIFTF001_008573 [Ficus carica]
MLLIFMDHGYRPPPSLAPANSAKATTSSSSLTFVGIFARGCRAATKKREKERGEREREDLVTELAELWRKERE